MISSYYGGDQAGLNGGWAHSQAYASKPVSFFLKKAGSVGFCEVTGSSINDGVGLRHKIPCKYKFCGRQAYADRLQTLLS